MTHEDNFNIGKWINENKATNEIKVVAGGGPLEEFKQTIYKLIEKDYGVEERDQIEAIIQPWKNISHIETLLDNFTSKIDEEPSGYSLYVYRKMIFGDNIY
jgi:hypothetical protein